MKKYLIGGIVFIVIGTALLFKFWIIGTCVFIIGLISLYIYFDLNIKDIDNKTPEKKPVKEPPPLIMAIKSKVHKTRYSVYYENLVKLELSHRIYCDRKETDLFETQEDDELPDDVFNSEYNESYSSVQDTDKYWRYSDFNMPGDAMRNLILLKSALNIKIIKSCVIFFTILMIILLIVNLIAAFL